MPRRAASVTQADIARAIRAAKAAGLTSFRLVQRSDGLAMEVDFTKTDSPREDGRGIQEPPPRKIVL